MAPINYILIASTALAMESYAENSAVIDSTENKVDESYLTEDKSRKNDTVYVVVDATPDSLGYFSKDISDYIWIDREGPGNFLFDNEADVRKVVEHYNSSHIGYIKTHKSLSEPRREVIVFYKKGENGWVEQNLRE